jgi:hypothetical protein
VIWQEKDQISLAKITATNLSDMAFNSDYSQMMDVLNNLKEEKGEHKLRYGLIMDNKGYSYAHTDDRNLGAHLKDPQTENILKNLNLFEKEKFFIQEFKDPVLNQEIAVPFQWVGDLCPDPQTWIFLKDGRRFEKADLVSDGLRCPH